MPTDLALLRLLQLVSPGLPVGMYSYSQGLERAIHDGWLTTGDDIFDWLAGVLRLNLSRVDAPLLSRMHDDWTQQQMTGVLTWNRMLYACRETAELRLEDRQTGQALARLLWQLDIVEAKPWIKQQDTTFAALFSLAAVRWQISKSATLLGYLWSWLENQVLCAVKLVPLGQVAGQLLLQRLSLLLPTLVEQALNMADAEIGGGAFALSLASSRHETQYSRLFRS